MMIEKIKKSLLWDITLQCNLQCRHCYNSDKNDLTEEALDIKNNIKLIIDRIEKLDINHIHLLGGEPLLAEGLFDLLDYAGSKDIRISVNTNGMLLNSTMIKKLIESKISQITISLDGASAQANDMIRGNGTFEIISKNMKDAASAIKASGSGIIMQVATVVTKQNIKEMNRLPYVLKNLGVYNLNILKLYECGSANQNEDMLCISDEEYIAALEKLLLECYRNKIFIQIDCKPKVLQMIANKYGFSVALDSVFNRCPASDKILYMNDSGYIYPCAPIAHSMKSGKHTTMKLANIMDENSFNLLSAYKSMVQQNLKSNTATSRICSSCEFKDQCNGCAICYNGYDKLCEVAQKVLLPA